jgi:hypothetical protein
MISSTSISATRRVIEMLPEWISSELVSDTQSVWKSEYREELTTGEVVGLLQNLAGVFRVLKGDDNGGDDCM